MTLPILGPPREPHRQLGGLLHGVQGLYAGPLQYGLALGLVGSLHPHHDRLLGAQVARGRPERLSPPCALPTRRSRAAGRGPPPRGRLAPPGSGGAAPPPAPCACRG